MVKKKGNQKRMERRSLMNPSDLAMLLWKFGDVKSYTSLKLLATIFNIPTPKDDIDGSDVIRVFWQEKNLPRIITYCQKDVITVAQLLLRFKGLPLMTEQD